MEVEGKEYTQDLIVFPDRVISPWWRIEGHRVAVKDLEAVWPEKMDYLIIGTGAYGMMQVDREVKKKAAELGINLIIEETAEAVMTYNRFQLSRQTVGAFHLTC